MSLLGQDDEARGSLPDAIRCMTESLEHLEEAVGHLQRVVAAVERHNSMLHEDLVFFDRVMRRGQQGVQAMYGLVSLLSFYMTGACPEGEIIDAALGEGAYLPREVREQIKRFDQALNEQQKGYNGVRADNGRSGDS